MFALLTLIFVWWVLSRKLLDCPLLLLTEAVGKIFIVKVDAVEVDETPMRDDIDPLKALLQRCVDFFLLGGLGLCEVAKYDIFLEWILKSEYLFFEPLLTIFPIT